MYISARTPQDTYASLFRWCGRSGGAMVVTAWLALVIWELAQPGAEHPSVDAYYQAAALALVFAGYALGWRKEFAGGVLTIVGTIAFFAVQPITIDSMPGLEAAFFALPGVFYLLAWKYDDPGKNHVAST
jgi:hypothetical protein